MPVNVTSDVTNFTTKSYDFVIVGGGTAGLALASRLSENPNFTIGVLEAGQDLSEDPFVKSAGGWLTTTSSPAYSWRFETNPQVDAAGQKIPVPRGKLLGGCSAMNAMIWTRACKSEYDIIAELGNPGWSFEDLVPYFKKTQSHAIQPRVEGAFPGTNSLTEFQGSEGPVKTSYNTWYSSLIPSLAESVSNLSVKTNSTPDNGDMTGFSNMPRAVDNKTGLRQHSGVTYLEQTAGRNNIVVLVGALATNVIFSGEGGDLTATAVEFLANGVHYIVHASKEVVLSAGSFQTPQLLELSGIGQQSILDKAGVKTLIELPVGENLQDHLMISMNFGLTTEAQANLGVFAAANSSQDTDAGSTTTGGPFVYTNLRAISASEAQSTLISLLDSYLSETLTPLERIQLELQRKWLTSQLDPTPDIQVMFASMPGVGGVPLPDGQMTMWLLGAHLHPASRGTVHITTKDPSASPAIDPRWLSREYDALALKEAVRFVYKITKTEPLASIVTGSVVPAPDIKTDEQLLTYIKTNITPVFHPIGTAAMAPRGIGGVVDPQLKVYGTKNLRIVDASIIPLQIGSTPMSTVYVIAEKAADMIKAAYA